MARIAAVSREQSILLERQISRQVKDYLQYRGWRPIRMQRTVVPGAFQSGEPGIPDYLFVKYLPELEHRGVTVALWVEFKRPGGALRRHQADWHSDERLKGAQVWVVEDFNRFAKDYERAFGWLHSGEVRGQMELRMTDKQREERLSRVMGEEERQRVAAAEREAGERWPRS